MQREGAEGKEQKLNGFREGVKKGLCSMFGEKKDDTHITLDCCKTMGNRAN